MSLNVIVMGATSAIAQAVCRQYATQMANLCLVGRDGQRLQALSQEFRDSGAGLCTVVQGDVASPQGAIEAIEQSFQKLQQVDVCLIAQGALQTTEEHEQDPLRAADLFTVNTASPVAAALKCSQLMLPRGGVIAIIGSVAGDRGRASNFVYGATKAALATFAEGLRARNRPRKIKVLLIKPGPVRTPMTAGMRGYQHFADPEQVGAAIVRAIAKRRRVLYVPGWWRLIMFGIRTMPSFILDRVKF